VEVALWAQWFSRVVGEILPIRALHYAPGYARSHSVLSPPYDVLSREDVERLYALDPHNAVRVEFGLESPGDVRGSDDRYTRAKSTLLEWLADGVLQEEARPVMFLSEHRFPSPDGSRELARRGIFGGLAPLPWDAPGGILPHERTFAGPKADRLELLRATGVATSPVFGFWDGGSSLEQHLVNGMMGDPFIETRMQGEFGPETHRLWRVEEQPETARIMDAIRQSTLFIADGHHRYETSIGFINDERGGDGSVLAYLCAADDPGVCILATHRIVTSPGLHGASLDDITARMEEGWRLERVQDTDSASSVAGLEERLAEPGMQAVGVIAHGGAGLLTRKAATNTSPARSLPVWALHEEILPAVAGDAVDIRFTRSAAEAGDAVKSGHAEAAFLLPSCSTADIMAVAEAGEVMPHKSTYFYPKVPSGLVMARV
jgi:uncharacterized protein (DUF1015 family)